MDEEWDEDLDLDDGEPDEEYLDFMVEASRPLHRKLGWRVAGAALGLACDIAEDFGRFFENLAVLVVQRANWEEERQEFSDSVKSDFLVVKTLETEEES